MKALYLVFLLFVPSILFTDTFVYPGACMVFSLPAGWEGTYTDDGAYRILSPEEEAVILIHSTTAVPENRQERQDMITGLIARWNLDMELFEMEETRINGIPLTASFCKGSFLGEEGSAVIMMLSPGESGRLGLLLVAGTEDAWNRHEADFTRIFMNLERSR